MTVSDRSDQPTVISTERARGGETSGRIRRVLGVSMTLTIIALGGLVVWWAVFH